tara:strand:- start:1083 stop:2327 length:1245 start_codon:yes stop_codon:yes gene_type:complete
MSRDTADAPVILIVAFPISIHAARWVNTFRNRGFRVVLFPGVLQGMCIEFEPTRQVRCRADLDALQPGEIGIYPREAVRGVTQADVDDPAVYPFALPAFDLPPEIRPDPDALCEAVAAIRPDLVHSLELQHCSYLAKEARRRFGASFPPWVASCWGSDIFMYRKLKEHRPILTKLVREVDALHSDCARDLAWAEEKAGYDAYRFPQMPASGGVDFSIFPDPARLSRPSERKMILVKGYHGWAGRGMHILYALHLVAPQLKGFRIVVTHSGRPAAEMVERLASEDGLDISLDPYLASNAEAMERLASARVAVGYGISDGISTTLLEAMALGTFMIQANTCCGNEWVSNGSTGLIVPPHDVVALANAIVRAATDDALVDDAVEINRATVEARWNAETNGALIANAYRELLGMRADE